jgi:hypothetical protein
MVDNVLLEKRNRYLGKLIKKTHNLTESVKLLSIIDKELYSQSGGTFTRAIEKLRNPVVVHTSESSSLNGLKNVVDELQATINKFSEFETEAQKMTRAVIYKMGPTNTDEMNKIIAAIKTQIGTLDKHVIITITKFLTDPDFTNAANQYIASAEKYNNSQTEDNSKQLTLQWINLKKAFDSYTIVVDSNKKAILQSVFDLMYPKPPLYEGALSKTGSSPPTPPLNKGTLSRSSSSPQLYYQT